MQLLDHFKKYVEFGEADVERLRQLRGDLEPQFPELIDAVLESLHLHGRMEPLLELGRETERVRSTFLSWLEATFSGSMDEAYIESQRQIGRRCHAYDLDPEYALCVMNVLRTQLVRLLLETEIEVPLDRALESIERVIDLNVALVIDSYWSEMKSEKDEVGTKLAASMAHEIRNPLNAVELHLTLLQRRLSEARTDPEKCLPMIDEIRSELQRIETLTQKITRFTRPNFVLKNWYETESFVSELESSYADTLETRNIEFNIDLGDSIRIYCDATQLKQALANILRNAMESIEDEGEISLEVRTEGNETTISISDNGEGLETGATRRIFELFYTTKPAGTGLGLPAAKRIVDEHGGAIDVRSNAAGGTTVDVVLPHPKRPETERAAERN